MSATTRVLRPRISDDDAALMRGEYEAGATREALADRWGWSGGAICAAIERVGGKMRRAGKARSNVLPVPDSMVVSLRERGMSYAAIAARFNVPPIVVERVLGRARRAEARR